MRSVRAGFRAPAVALATAVLAASFLAGSGTALAAPAAAPTAAPSPGQVVEGRLVQAWPEYHDRAAQLRHGEDGPLSWVRTSDGSTVRVPTDELAGIKGATPGAHVRMTVGESLRDAAAAEQGLAPARRVLAGTLVSPAPSSPASPTTIDPSGLTDAVTVVMVQPGGVAQDGRSLQDVVNEVDGGVATFWSTQTNGRIVVGVTAQHDWMSTTHTCADPLAMWSEVATDVQWTPGPGRHLLLYVPPTAPGCEYGLAEVGASVTAGGAAYVTDVATSLIAHELGHNFSLGHSSALQCDGTVDGADGKACDLLPYGDLYDVMGGSWNQVGSLSAPQAARLGVLPSGRIADMAASGDGGTVTLTPVDQHTGTQAIRLTDAEGDVYWLEDREAEGQDVWLGASASNVFGLESGVLLRLAWDGSDAAGDTSLLLDGTPSAQGDWGNDASVVVPVATPAVSVAGGEFVVRQLSARTVQVVTRDSIQDVYQRAGGPGGRLGYAHGPESCGTQGCWEAFDNGTIYWSAVTKAHIVSGSVLDRYQRAGAAAGSLGYPTTDTFCGLAGGGCFSHFQGGSIYGHYSWGAYVVPPAVRSVWAGTGWEVGQLGYPSGEQFCGLRGGGCVQNFDTGLVYTVPGLGSYYVPQRVGNFDALYRMENWENGRLGYPVSNPICGLRNGGCFQRFQGGSMYASRGTPGVTVLGAIGAKWATTGWENGLLGYPGLSEHCLLAGGGCYQVFEGGTIYWSPATGAHWLRGAIRNEWAATGWEVGSLGYPTSDEICGLRNGGCLQTFQRGSVYWAPGWGAHQVTGALLAAWGATGWERGSLGYPATDPYPVPGGVAQRFQGGLLTWSGATNVVTRSR